jgi:hypothetical protein
MSSKAPDVICRPPAPETALTLAEMHALRWLLVARCNKCRLAVRVNLALLIRVHGPDCIWWGHQPPCPGLDCRDGRLTYTAQSIKGGSARSLAAKAPERCIALWKQKRGQFHPGPR